MKRLSFLLFNFRKICTEELIKEKDLYRRRMIEDRKLLKLKSL